MSCIAPRCGEPRAPGSLFCRPHEQASAAQRGGWISAEKRRRALAASKETALDASNITKRLWIGGQPPLERDLPFDVIALCAAEVQPERVGFPRSIVRVPLHDRALSSFERRRALHGAQVVARELAGGKRVLVTCYAGLNRSSLVAGLALGMVTRMTAAQIVELIRARRSEQALHNEHFVEYIHTFVRTRPAT